LEARELNSENKTSTKLPSASRRKRFFMSARARCSTASNVGWHFGDLEADLKRFTETTKWNDQWFMNLSERSKLLWFYLLDHCDNSGVIELNTKLAAFQIGGPIDPQHLTELSSRLKTLPNGKIWIEKFIQFQYGKLGKESRPHLQVLSLIASHGLPLSQNDTPNNNTNIPSVKASDSLRIGPKTGTRQDKDKEQDKDKDKEGDARGSKNSPDLFIGELFTAYRRDPGSVLTYMEQSSLAEIVRERPRHMDEWKIIQTLKQREPRYFPQSLVKLLTQWQETLDRASVWVPAAKTIKSVLEKELESIQ
jgi:hypothetical protein